MISIVIAKLPNAGLGNKLFVWARAVIFAYKNQLPLYIIGLNRIHIGPYLRGEKIKRFYFGQFKRNSLASSVIYYKHILKQTPKVYEPDLETVEINSACRYVFDSIPSWKNYFQSLHQYRSIIIEAFESIQSPKVKRILNGKNKINDITVHIRMGDFKALPEGADFKLYGATRTPLDYFIKCIHKIRLINNESLNVLIFSDGYAAELEKILQEKQTELTEPELDVIDLVKLSRAKIIITSAHSSFSEWAGFLSDAAIIRHPDHIHGKIRIEEVFFEGSVEDYEKYLKKKEIPNDH